MRSDGRGERQEMCTAESNMGENGFLAGRHLALDAQTFLHLPAWVRGGGLWMDLLGHTLGTLGLHV